MSQLDVKHDAELERIVSDAIQAVSGDLRQISLDVSSLSLPRYLIKIILTIDYSCTRIWRLA